MTQEFRSGFVTIIGKPNVGKSTLLNNIIGEKIAIMSDKPQTTRNKIMAVYSQPGYQIVFMDTPGIHEPKNKLGEIMVKTAEATLNEVDVILFVVDAEFPLGNGEKKIIEQIKKSRTPIILLINKIDLVQKEKILPLINEYNELCQFHAIIPISALTGDGINELINELKKLMPVGPQYFPEDTLTDQPEKQIVAELIREKLIYLLDKEIPYGIAVEVLSIKTRKNKEIVEILANIYCERDSHKGIIIGKNGVLLKKVGTKARVDIENLLGSKVFLQLWVKVKKDWRNNNYQLKDFGYQ